MWVWARSHELDRGSWDMACACCLGHVRGVEVLLQPREQQNAMTRTNLFGQPGAVHMHMQRNITPSGVVPHAWHEPFCTLSASVGREETRWGERVR